MEVDFNMAFISQNQDGFQMTSSSYDNGRIFCTFSRSIVAENMDEDRNLTESVYLFLAIGSMRGEYILLVVMCGDMSSYS